MITIRAMPDYRGKRGRGGIQLGWRLRYGSHIAGSFLGFAKDTYHRLDNGTCWRQHSDYTEPACSDRPECWVYTDGNVHYLEVSGCTGIVEIRAGEPPSDDWLRRIPPSDAHLPGRYTRGPGGEWIPNETWEK